MTSNAAATPPSAPEPYDRQSFLGLTFGQFLGAFNDNVFKQLVLLLCIDHELAAGVAPNTYQSKALVVFALPWVLFSGLAGFVSDRTSKQRGIVLYKVLEIGITLAGMAAFWSNELAPVFAVLFCLSLHSTFFGPCKYGILPDLFPKSALPFVNGIFQMTTFLAIIFGMAFAGYGKELLPGQAGLVKISFGCVVFATLGTFAVLFVRRTQAVQPDLRWSWSALGVNSDAWALLKRDRFLTGVLLLTSLFWFMGGVVQPSVNVLGKVELGLKDGPTSILAACMGLGIASGCGIAGKFSRGRIRFGLVTLGSWLMSAMLVTLTLVAVAAQSKSLPVSVLEWIARVALVGLGASAGLFVVPLQVVLQASPPEELKGRMIGTMNLANWIGILLSALFVGIFAKLLPLVEQAGLPKPMPSSIFAVLALMVVPVALFYRPADRDL